MMSVANLVGDKSLTIYVGNLSFEATEEDIRGVFAEYGEVVRITLPIDRETGNRRGFAFINLAEDAQEDLAISELDGAEWLGRDLRVNKAKPKGDDSRSPRPKGRFSRNPL